MEALVQQKQNLILILLKQTQNFSSVCIIMLMIVIFFVNGKEIFNFKANNKNVNFPNFILEAYLMDLVILSQENYL